MKKNKYIILGIIAMAMSILVSGCQDTEDLVTPNVASPVLVLLEGSSFPADGEIGVSATFLELDKSGILDHAVGIDSIPVSDMEVMVYINDTDEVGKWVTGADGKVVLSVSWDDLGLSPAMTGEQVRLEIAGSYKNISFRKYHTVRVE